MSQTYSLGETQGSKWIKCLRCGRVSYNPNDIAQLYCGTCGFHEGAGPFAHDRIDLGEGAASLPADFRRIAAAANRAGLDGFELVTTEVGLDTQDYVRAMKDGSAVVPWPKSLFTLTYRRVGPGRKPEQMFERLIVTREMQGDGSQSVKLECGHSSVQIIPVASESIQCAQCVNEFVRKGGVSKTS